ncbi:DgyrCDS4264 [Dimorphilus gyrociliatus]|uniref:DgyrCDS4264 n=1 Tax=Dimorphilus gyrociliatus TaxID=2664684 RepID=A0A7I8VG41_9ANNE|nr:DgyrCDS4264 [Dimorphilus gyrociliatus]
MVYFIPPGPSRESYVAEKGRSARTDNNIDNCELANALCSILESILLHQHRGNNKALWDFVCKYTHKETIQELKTEKVLTCEIGLCRAWVRLALNQNLFESYLKAIIADSKSLEKYYNNTAFLRDLDQLSVAQMHIQYITSLKFSLPIETGLINTWPETTLILAGYVSGDVAPSLLVGPEFESLSVNSCDNSQLVVEVSRSRSKKLRKSKPISASGASSEECSVSNASFQSSSLSFETGFPVNNERKQFPVEDNSPQVEVDLNESKSKSDETLETATCDIPSTKSTNPFDEIDEKCFPTCPSQETTVFDKEQFEEKESKQVVEVINSMQESEAIAIKETDNIPTEDNSIYDLDYLVGNSLNRQLDRMAFVKKEKSSTDDNTSKEEIETFLTHASSSTEIIEATDHRNESDLSKRHSVLSEKGFEVITVDDEIINNQESFDYQESLLDRLCTENGLDDQKFTCKGCNRNIGLIYGEHKVCWFDKAYYCTECQGDDEYYIPSRILYNWDFNKYPVSKRNLQFIKMIEHEGVLDIQKNSPFLYAISDGLKNLRKTRQRLCFCKDYLLNCSLSVREHFRKTACPKEYYYCHVDTYSLYDLLALAKSDVLEREVHDMYTYAKKHIFECVLCRQKGFYCEICRNNEIIFPFELERVTKCNTCGSIFHKNCRNNTSHCPKCQRLEQRRSKEDDYALAPL